MARIIALLFSIFSFVVTAANKTFVKSERAALTFNISGITDFTQSFEAQGMHTAINFAQKTLLQEITDLQRGDGLYTVFLRVSNDGTTDIFKQFSDKIGGGSTVVLELKNGTLLLKSFTLSHILLTDNAKSQAQAAKGQAMEAARIDSTNKSNQAKAEANQYTDLEISKLQRLASIGIKGYRTFEGLVSEIGNVFTIAQMPSYVAFGIDEIGAYMLSVTGVNADGSILDDKEFKMKVDTDFDVVTQTATSIEISVSTNDKLIFEKVKLSDGTFFLKFVSKYDDRTMEIIQQLKAKIETQVSEVELGDALQDMKVWVLDNLNPALK